MLEHKLDTQGFSDEAKELIKRQLEQYPDYRDVIENGKLNRLMSPSEDGGKSAGYYISEDRCRVVVFYHQQNGEEPREYRLKVKVPAGSVWTAPFNNYAPYHDFDLNTGIIVRSSGEGGYGEVYMFCRSDKGAKKLETAEHFFEKWVSDERMSPAASAALAEKVRGNERFERIIRDFEYKKITTVEPDKEAYLFISSNNHEMLLLFYQPKGEAPREYRLRIDVPDTTVWTGTITRESTYETENTYHKYEFYSGIIVRSSEEDDHAEIFHFIR